MLMLAAGMAVAETTLPLLAIAPVEGDSPRSTPFAGLVRTHLVNIAGSTGIFEMVNVDVLDRQIEKFGCSDEQCQIRFARDAGISFILRGQVKDRGDHLELFLYAYGIQVPHFGKMINSYRVKIPVSHVRQGEKEYSYMAEEHAGFFLSTFLGGCKTPVAVEKRDTQYRFDYPLEINGEYPLYSFKNGDTDITTGIPSLYEQVGHVIVSGNIVSKSSPAAGRHEDTPLIPGDFILISYSDTSSYLEDFYRGRKREIVLANPTADDTCMVMAFSVPASATMPVVVPLLGYYQDGDYAGLGLWAMNTIPYLYIEYHGLRNSPEKMREDRNDISRHQLARNYFGWYMLLAGGLPQFVDAFSHDYLNRASKFEGEQPLMGNTATALYLSLVSGGGGHFYRGYRGWGYLYYHAQNLLLYGILYNWAQPEYYNSDTKEYEKGQRNTTRAYTFASVLGVVKIIEMVHVLMIDDNIRNGKVVEEMYTLHPVIMAEPDGALRGGAAITLRY